MALRKETRSVIVREKDGEFILVKQHDHSQLAGRIAAHWRHRPEPYESTLLAIREHDLGWQLLDESVRLNPTTGRPYSFMDLPLEERLPAYTWGIDQVEKIDPYAACLCSRHYVSLLRPYENEHPLVRSFVAKEQKRDARLTADMDETARCRLDENLELLKTCDRLSLFLCLNEPGENTFPRYRDGIQSGKALLRPVWLSPSTLRFEPNPFAGQFRVRIPYVRMSATGRILASSDVYIDIVP